MVVATLAGVGAKPRSVARATSTRVDGGTRHDTRPRSSARDRETAAERKPMGSAGRARAADQILVASAGTLTRSKRGRRSTRWWTATTAWMHSSDAISAAMLSLAYAARMARAVIGMADSEPSMSNASILSWMTVDTRLRMSVRVETERLEPATTAAEAIESAVPSSTASAERVASVAMASRRPSTTRLVDPWITPWASANRFPLATESDST